jgi:hypothetical protein
VGLSGIGQGLVYREIHEILTGYFCVRPFVGCKELLVLRLERHVVWQRSHWDDQSVLLVAKSLLHCRAALLTPGDVV